MILLLGGIVAPNWTLLGPSANDIEGLLSSDCHLCVNRPHWVIAAAVARQWFARTAMGYLRNGGVWGGWGRVNRNGLAPPPPPWGLGPYAESPSKIMKLQGKQKEVNRKNQELTSHLFIDLHFRLKIRCPRHDSAPFRISVPPNKQRLLCTK